MLPPVRRALVLVDEIDVDDLLGCHLSVEILHLLSILLLVVLHDLCVLDFCVWSVGL